MADTTVPEDAVPEQTDQTQADQTDIAVDKKQVTQREYDMIKRSGRKDMSDYQIVEPTEQADDAAVPENQDHIEEQDGDGEDTTPAAAEGIDSEDIVPEASTPDKDEADDQFDSEGFKYGTFAGREYREDKDGNVQYKMKIYGQDEYVNADVVLGNAQLKQVLDKRLQEVAEREKQLEARESFNKTLSRFVTPSQQAQTDYEDDDFVAGEEQRTVPAPANEEVAQLRKRLDELESERQMTAEQQMLAVRIGDAIQKATAYCKKMEIPVSVDFESATRNKSFDAKVAAYAANRNMSEAEVMTDPNAIIDVLSAMSRPKPPVKVEPSAEGVPKPTSAARPRSSKPVGGVNVALDKARKKLEALRKMQDDGKVKNQRKHVSELMKTNSEILRLEAQLNS